MDEGDAKFLSLHTQSFCSTVVQYDRLRSVIMEEGKAHPGLHNPQPQRSVVHSRRPNPQEQRNLLNIFVSVVHKGQR